MKAPSRSPWLTSLALLAVLAAPIAGERTAHAGTRSCTLDGAWMNTGTGTTNKFDVTGVLKTTKDDLSFFFGYYVDGQNQAEVEGYEMDGTWSFNFEFGSGGTSNGMVKLAKGAQVATDSKKDFQVTGTYATYVNRVDIDRSGDFTLSGTCVKD